MALTKPVTEVLNTSTIAADGTTALGSCSAMDLSQASHFGLTVRAQFDASAVAGITVHLRSSPGGGTYDTQDVGVIEDGTFSLPTSFVAGSHAGATLQKSVPTPVKADLKYYKVVVENNDSTHAVNNVTVDEIKQKVAPYTG